MDLREGCFLGLRWGMPPHEFLSVHKDADYVMEARPGVFTQVGFCLHGQPCLCSFEFARRTLFGKKGLQRVIGSFLFEAEGKRLDQADVITTCVAIRKAVSQLYGAPWINVPWDGSTLVLIWRTKETFIQCAWDGGNAWGLHYRSISWDKEVPGIIAGLEAMPLPASMRAAP